ETPARMRVIPNSSMQRCFIGALSLACLLGCSRNTSQNRGKGDDAQDKLGKGERVLLQNKGSDTLVNVAQAWAEAYKSVNPKIAIAVTGGGSGTGISALINGTVDLASSSRTMKS